MYPLYTQRTHNVYTPKVVTPARNIRIDDALWEAAQEKAADRRETVTAVIKRALVAYVEDDNE